MREPRPLFVAGLLCGAVAVFAPQTQTRPPVRALGRATVSIEHGASAVTVRELAGGRVMVIDYRRRQVYILDAYLVRVEIVFDSAPGTATSFPEGAKFIPHIADSTFIHDRGTSSLLLYDPAGKFVRVTASPLGRESYRLGNPGSLASDQRGRIVYQIPWYAPDFPLCRDGKDAETRPSPTGDSTLLARASFDTRSSDTVARMVAPVAIFPVVGNGADCKPAKARMTITPVSRPIDDWTVTSSGSIAIVRGGTYSVDWIEPDGSRRSTPRMPFDWRRITDEEKQIKIDSARRITDSVADAGGYHVRACMSEMSRSVSYFIDAPKPPPPGSPPAAANSGASGRSGGTSNGEFCAWLAIARDYPALSEIPDYVPPIRSGAVLADRDDNVWILPTTSREAKNGLLYDVVNRKGELFERVELPTDRAIAGFGKGGVVYLNWRDASGVWSLERRVIQR